VKREWQVAENQIQHDMEARDKSTKEADTNSQFTKKSKLEMSDSDDEKTHQVGKLGLFSTDVSSD